MRKCTYILLFSLSTALAFTTSAMAENTTRVYKTVNQDGSTTYSDQATGAAEAIDLKPVPTIPALDIKSGAGLSTAAAQDKLPYSQFIITSPTANSAFYAGDGNVNVTLEIQPNLSRRHLLELYLDGTKVTTQASSQFQLTNVDRGTHRLTIKAINSAGKVLQSTNSSFTIHRPIKKRPIIN